MFQPKNAKQGKDRGPGEHQDLPRDTADPSCPESRLTAQQTYCPPPHPPTPTPVPEFPPSHLNSLPGPQPPAPTRSSSAAIPFTMGPRLLPPEFGMGFLLCLLSAPQD